MSPIELLGLTLLVTAAGMAWELVRGRRHRARLQGLADEWKMAYSPSDHFRLTPRVAKRFPVPGAANIRVHDLIYGVDEGEYRYIFTAEYTAGVVHGKRRVVRAGTLSEPRDRPTIHAAAEVRLAPADLPLLEQYRRLNPGNAKP